MPEGQPQAFIPSSHMTSAEGVKFSEGSIRWQLTATDIITEIARDLRGEEFDFNSASWRIPEGQRPLMNEEGIRTVLTIIKSRVNKIVFLSNLSEDKINDFCRDINLDLVDQFVLKWEDWECEKENLSMLTRKIMHMVYCGLMRARDGDDKKYFGALQQVKELVTNQPNKSETHGGLFSLFKR